MKLRSLLTFILLVVVVGACGGKTHPKSGTTGPTSEPTPTTLTRAGSSLSGTPVSLLSLGLQTIPVRWTPAEVFEMSSVQELVDPFALDRERLKIPSAVPGRWSVQIVEGEAAPRELYSTSRWLRNLSWDAAGLAVVFSTRRSVQVAPFGGTVTPSWQGKTVLNPATGGSRDEFEVLPLSEGPGPAAMGRNVIVQQDLEGKQALVAIAMGSGPFQQLEAVYIVDARGKARRLEGLTGLRHLNWLPSGDTLQAYKSSPVPANDAYLIPTTDGQAIFLGTAPFGMEGYNAPPQVPATRALLLLPDPKGSPSGASIMAIYDSKTHQLRILGPGPALPGPNAAGFPTQVPILWPTGSDSFFIGIGIDAVIVDAKTGAMRPGQPQELLTPYMPPVKTSPGGRYLAWFDEPQAGAMTEDCRGKPFRLNLKDNQTGLTKPLLECPTGMSGLVMWISDTKLISTVFNCTGCGPGSFSLVLIDVTMGTATSLTDGLEDDATALASPDASRILVAGKTLRVYDSGGQLQRDLGPAPEAFAFKSFAWSPDSKSFAFVIEPKGLFLGGP